MNKNKFLKLLKNNLKYMPEKKKENILEEYEMHFVDGINEHRSEEEIAIELGNPIEIAKEVNAVFAMNQAEENRSIKTVTAAVVSNIGLGITSGISGIVVLFLVFVFSIFSLAYIFSVVVMISSPIILAVMGFVNGFDTIGRSEVFQVIKGITIGPLLAIVGYYIGKSFIKLLMNILRWNISIYKGEKVI